MSTADSHGVASTTASSDRVPLWRIALLFGVAGGVAALLVTPYVLALRQGPPNTMGLPFPVAVAISWLQNSVLLFLLSWAGLRLGAPLGLGAPVISAWMSRRAPSVRGHWLLAAALGGAAGGAIVLLDAVAFRHAVTEAMAQAGRTLPHIARWKGALASFYGGIAEEIELRLFFMTAIAWCLAKVTRRRSPAIFVVANIVAATAFGAGHLPMAGHVLGLTTVIVVRTMLLNGLGGIVFGALYSHFGLEHAMLAHFCADIVLHVVLAG
jgi:hypothetical protein